MKSDCSKLEALTPWTAQENIDLRIRSPVFIRKYKWTFKICVFYNHKNRNILPDTFTKVPAGPKLLITASTKPKTYKALAKILAKKNITPIEPPNSGPRVLLIMSEIYG